MIKSIFQLFGIIIKFFFKLFIKLFIGIRWFLINFSLILKDYSNNNKKKTIYKKKEEIF